MTKIQLYWYCTILIIAAFLRFWQIGSIPSGVTNDEAGSIYSSYSISNNGRSLDGKLLPLTFNLDNSYGPVAIYLDAPFIWLFGPNAYGLRLPFAILSLGSVVVLCWLTLLLTGNTWIALSSALGLAISPWAIHMNHGAYDGPIVFLFLVSVSVFVYQVRRGNILWSLPWIALSFYSYHATKIFWIVFIPVLLWMYWKELRDTQKPKLYLFIAAILALVFSFLFVLRTQSITRQHVLLTPDRAALTREVNSERTYSRGPQILRRIFVNKAILYRNQLLSRYAQAFTPQFLFLYGEGGIYGTYRHGVLYFIDSIILAAGIIYLIRSSSKRVVLFIVGSILISPLPSTVTVDVSFALRGIFMLPFLMILWGMGLYQIGLWCVQQHPVAGTVIGGAVCIAYCWSVASFLYVYFYQYPVYGAEYWFASSRDVAVIAGALRKNYAQVYIGGAGKMFLFQYALYNHVSLDKVRKAWNTLIPPYTLDNVHVLENCLGVKGSPFNPALDLPPSALYITRESCHPEATPAATIRDQGESLRKIWTIYDRQ